MRTKTLTLIASALLLASAVPAHAVGRLVDVQVVDRVTGETLVPILFHGEWWIAGRPGARYGVTLLNRNGQRTLNVVSVDGINAISGDTAAWDQTGYVLGPYQRTQVDGWRKDVPHRGVRVRGPAGLVCGAHRPPGQREAEATSPQPKARAREPQGRERSIARSIDATPVKPARLPDELRARPQAPATSGFPRTAACTRASGGPVARYPGACSTVGDAGGPTGRRTITGQFGRDVRENHIGGRGRKLLRITIAANAARTRIGRVVEPATPRAWAERIVKLRADGNHAEADRELDALRQRYPRFEIPAGALRPSGTR